jgi:hypothetical protein
MDTLQKVGKMTETSFGDVNIMYSYCGPRPRFPYYSEISDEVEEYVPIKDDRSGPRCKNCRKKMEETGENHFCGKIIPISSYRSPPDSPQHDLEDEVNKGAL